MLQISSISHDVPFGDKFMVQERIHFLPAANGGADVQIHSRCIFLKSCGLLQHRIKATSAVEVTKAGEKLLAVLQLRSIGNSISNSPVQKATCTLEIWELQRRYTLFSHTWHAPFLPHDGVKRWRWVDESYQKHPWTTVTNRLDAAKGDVPPVKPERGWGPLAEWMVSHGTDCDSEGWQYAIDFYHHAMYWTESPQGFHVRRRLWTRCFQELDGFEGQCRPPLRQMFAAYAFGRPILCCAGERSIWT